MISQSDIDKLKKFTDKLKKKHKSSIYLVGSALTKRKPRDIDVAMVISDSEFERQFGSVEIYDLEQETGEWSLISWNWSKACIRIWKHFCKSTGMNIDFKIYSYSYDRKHFTDKPKFDL